MALANYGDLKASIASWLNRSDMTSVIPDLVTLAQARINRDMESVRERADITIANEVNAIAATVGEVHSITLEGYGPLQITTPQYVEWELTLAGGATGVPRYAAFSPGIAGGGSLRVAPAPDGSYAAKIVYQPVYAAFASDSATDDLLTYHPDIYLFGSLAQAEPFLKNDERIATWETKYTSGMESLRLAMKRRQYPNTPIVRPRRALGEING